MNKQNGLALIIVVLIIVTVAGEVFLLGKAYNKLGTTQQTPQPSPTQPTLDETADWKTYTNTKLKFKVKYPSDPRYGVDEMIENEVLIGPEQSEADFFLRVIDNPNKLTLLEWLRKSYFGLGNIRSNTGTSNERVVTPSESDVKLKYGKIAGQEAIEASLLEISPIYDEYPSPPSAVVFYTPDKKSIYLIAGGSFDSLYLKTFEFID